MAKDKQQVLDQAIAAAVAAAKDLTNDQAQHLSIDVAASGEYPYRVLVPDEQLPLIGMARRD